jgi:hypothetical protein
MLLSQAGLNSVSAVRPVTRSNTRSSVNSSFPNRNIVVGMPKISRT